MIYQLIKNKKKKKKCVWMDQIGQCTCYILKNKFLNRELTLLLQGSQYQKRQNILRSELLISDISKKRQEQTKSYVTRFRQVFHCGRNIWKPLYKIMKFYAQVKQTLIIG